MAVCTPGSSKNFFFRAEGGIRDTSVTGVQTCALPIWAAIVTRLNGAIVQAMKTPAVREALEKTGAQVVPDNRATPQYLGEFIKSEIEKWAAPIKASGVSVE